MKYINPFATDTCKTRRVVVAIADVSGSVKYYEEVGVESNDIDITARFVDIHRASDKEDRTNGAAIVFRGEDQFASPIVSCTFGPICKEDIRSEVSPENDNNSEEMNTVNNLLLVATTDGDLTLKHAADLGSKSNHDLEVSHFSIFLTVDLSFKLRLFHVEEH